MRWRRGVLCTVLLAAGSTLAGPTALAAGSPFGGVGNETVVSFFHNGVDTGSFKICKTTNDPAVLGSHTFTFHWRVFENGTPADSGTDGLRPGQCSGLHGPYPVVDSSGNATAVDVQETATTGVHVSTITYAGNGTESNNNPRDGEEIFELGFGVNEVTYDNEPNPLMGPVVPEAPWSPLVLIAGAFVAAGAAKLRRVIRGCDGARAGSPLTGADKRK